MIRPNKVVSIILPVFNGEGFIYDAISSVLHQSYHDWELLVVNDGSEDSTEMIIQTFDDERIRYFYQKKRGVSVARNLGLLNMKGDYFCFLDADDVMPPNGIKDRLHIFDEQPDISFVDGVVVYMNDDMTPTGTQFVPSFKGCPYDELLQLSCACYFGNTWMIKRERNVHYRFNQQMTHAEDLFFYLTLAKGRKYSYTESPVLYYRERENSAMKDLAGLEHGYFYLLKKVKQELQPDPATFKVLKKRIIRIMFLSHLFDGRDPYSAARSLFRYLLKA
jgi:glycosyltransferase involved in cell wall biosynthesis